jgi:hypothetical protein
MYPHDSDSYWTQFRKYTDWLKKTLGQYFFSPETKFENEGDWWTQFKGFFFPPSHPNYLEKTLSIQSHNPARIPLVPSDTTALLPTHSASTLESWGAWFKSTISSLVFWAVSPVLVFAIFFDFCRRCTDDKIMNSLFKPVDVGGGKTRPNLWGIFFSLSGSSTSVVGSIHAMDTLLPIFYKHKVARSQVVHFGLGFGVFSVLMQASFNLVNASSGHKEKKQFSFFDDPELKMEMEEELNVMQLNIIFATTLIASIASGVLAATVLTVIGVGGATAFLFGILLGIFNFISSYSGGAASNKVFFQEIWPKIKHLFKKAEYTILVFSFIFIILAFCLPIIYTPATVNLFQLKNRLYYWIVTEFVGATNLSVIPMFFNHAFDFICRFIDAYRKKDYPKGIGRNLSKTLALILLSPLYIFAAYGNGSESSQEYFSEGWINILIGGAAMATFFPGCVVPILDTVDKIADHFSHMPPEEARRVLLPPDTQKEIDVLMAIEA